MAAEPRQVRNWLGVIVAACLVCTAAVRAEEAPDAPIPAKIGFNRDVRPILSENCFSCHGPDKNKRKADLRLDVQDGGALIDHEGKISVVPNHPEKSELVQRVSATDPKELMPPRKSGKTLTPRQIAILKKWIEQGGSWQPLWSFIAPQRPELPELHGDAAWPRNAIDRFVLARLQKAGLRPSPEADKTTLIRRLSLDLLGLPPTPADVDAFLADAAPDAYEKLVDRLLANPHHGERLALDWLDAARYADTHGYHIDTGRDMTRWRQWVIDAFNRNQPFDQFTVEQLAGDLLPNATVDQKIASGFNRNNMINFEGGAVPEEYQTAYCVDRVNTTGTVWLGLTVGCSQCHDHKFDPISQKDFYRLYAYFNAVPENGLDGSRGNAVPLLSTPTSAQKQQLDEMASSIATLEQRLNAPTPELDAAQAQWEQAQAANQLASWTVLDIAQSKSRGGATLTKQPDKSVIASGPNPANDVYTLTADTGSKALTAVRVEFMPDNALPAKGPGRSPNGNLVMTGFSVTAALPAALEPSKPLKIARVSADFSQLNFPVSNLIDPASKAGWAIFPEVGKPHFAIFELETPLHAEPGTTLTVTLEFNSSYGEHQAGRIRLSSTDAPNPHLNDAVPGPVRSNLAIAPASRNDVQKAAIRTYYRTQVNPETRKINQQLTQLKKERTDVESKVPTTMVMAQMATPRDTFILMRGQYDKHGEKVMPGTPSMLSPAPAGAPANRLGLAQWIVDPSNPLTARVTVNRIWQTFFGTGIVKSAEDFGSQGEVPSHPELLDWLATEFVHPQDPASVAAGVRPWDVRAMVRRIVTSATYRQSSAISRDLLAVDPENRLLARGPRVRLNAEFIRDQALAASGLLNDQIGGASVSPYQPSGLWEELMSRGDGANWTAQTYTQSHGPDLYRRTMYTFWKRTCPPPTLATFDAPDREVCTVRRARTNTPLQALVLMNDPTYVEASRKLAERVMTEGGHSDEERIAHAFRLVLARKPSEKEVTVLRRIYTRQLESFKGDPAATEKLLKVGESPRNLMLDQPQLAAWTTVASVILNLDEAVTKG